MRRRTARRRAHPKQRTLLASKNYKLLQVYHITRVAELHGDGRWTAEWPCWNASIQKRRSPEKDVFVLWIVWTRQENCIRLLTKIFLLVFLATCTTRWASSSFFLQKRTTKVFSMSCIDFQKVINLPRKNCKRNSKNNKSELLCTFFFTKWITEGFTNEWNICITKQRNLHITSTQKTWTNTERQTKLENPWATVHCAANLSRHNFMNCMGVTRKNTKPL